MGHRLKADLTYLTLFAAVFLLFLGSCRKSERDEDTETVSAHDNAFAQHVFDQVFKVVHEYALQDTTLNQDGVAHVTDACLNSASLSNDIEYFPITLQLKYGAEETACGDEIMRQGALSAKFTGRYLAKGTQVSISFESFAHNSYTVTGKLNIENLGEDAKGNPLLLVKVTDGFIEGYATRIDFNSVQTYTWTSGYATDADISDDVFEISGHSKGRNSRGNSFYNDITVNYVYELGCNWIGEGESVLEVPNIPTRTLNYGSGGCDNVMTVTKYNTSTEVKF